MILQTQTKKEPFTEKLTRVRKKCIKQAKFIKDDNGDRVRVPAVYEDENYVIDAWIVETEYNGKTERHEFIGENAERDARNFYKGK